MIAISMLKFKATETVFSMSNMRQEVQFKRTKSEANIDEASEKTVGNLSWHFNTQT